MRVLITGASGFIGSQLGISLAPEFDVRGIVWSNRRPLPFHSTAADLTDAAAVRDALDDFRPQIVVHGAACSRVLSCEDRPELARRVNVGATHHLAEWCSAQSARLIFLSSDQVFSGQQGRYTESDLPSPLNEYGRTKLLAEGIVLAASPLNAVVRCNSVLGRSLGWGESFSQRVLTAVRTGTPMTLFDDQYRSPIHVRSLIRLLRVLCLKGGVGGLIHAGGPERLSRLEIARIVASANGLAVDCLKSESYRTHPRWAVMPRDTSFGPSPVLESLRSVTPRSVAEELAIDVQSKVVAS